MKRVPAIWPKNSKVPPKWRGKIINAARRLAAICLLADSDLNYVDADGLRVKVTIDAPRKRRKSKTR